MMEVGEESMGGAFLHCSLETLLIRWGVFTKCVKGPLKIATATLNALRTTLGER